MPSLRMSENCTEGAEQHRATTRPPDHPREMAHKMANKRASSTAARATSPLGALLPGRVAMLAALGFVVGEQLEDSSSFLLFDGNITGPAIGHYQQLGQGFWEPLLLAIGVCESYRVAVGWATPL